MDLKSQHPTREEVAGGKELGFLNSILRKTPEYENLVDKLKVKRSLRKNSGKKVEVKNKTKIFTLANE